MKADVPIRLLLDPWHFLALGCGSGLIWPAPGTWGSVLALIFWWALLANLSLIFYLAVLVLSAGLGVWLCGRTAKALDTEDHPAIVWDEFVGLWVTCLLLPDGWYWAILAFFVFRLLDIFKPWPIRPIDKSVKGGLGIMLDDLIAGVIGLALIQLLAWGLGATGTI